MADVKLQWLAADFEVANASIPEFAVDIGTNWPVACVGFTGSNEAIYKQFVAVDYASGDLTIKCGWFSDTGQTTGNVIWGATISALTPGDAQSVLTDGFATEATTTTTVNGTARGLTETSVTVNSLDSLANNDMLTLRIRKTGGTMTGDANLIYLVVSYLSV